MSEERIVIDFLPDGSVEVKTKGFQGSSCLEATKWIKEALGETLTTRKPPEFYADNEKSRQRSRYGG